VYPATIVGMPPMEDFYIGGASAKLILPISKMNFPEIVDIALRGAHASRMLVLASRRNLLCVWNVSGATPATAGGTPALPNTDP